MNPILAGGLGAALLAFLASRTQQGAAVVERVTDRVLGVPRGIRNNNPGNIDWIADPKKRWDGMVRKETPAEGGRFGVFDTPAKGVRAIGQELALDGRRGVRTIEGLIAGVPGIPGSGWAPSNENDTAAYIAAVARAVKMEPRQVIDVQSYLPRLAAAIIEHENGQQPYSLSDIQRWVYS